MSRTLLKLTKVAGLAAGLSLPLSACVLYDGPGDGNLHLTVDAPASADVKRTYAGTFPIAQAITVPPGYSTVYVSGMVPSPINGTTDQYGNTEAQTETVLKKIEEALKAEGLGFGDVVNMKVYLVGDPALGGKMDFAGMMKTYSKYFGTAEQPNKPTRATVQVSALVSPAYLVEIEVVAVKKAN
jgi:enamine deaminase RidA (YjgF/YER057c/UK114 family)